MPRQTRSLTSLALASALALGAVALALGSARSLAAEGPDPVKARKEAMEEINKNMKTLSAIAKKETPFDAAAVKKAAGTIAADLKKASTLFPAGSEKGSVPTEARPEIWSDSAGFSATMASAHAAAEGLAKVEDEKAFLPALRALGGNCKECHDMYRVAKKR